MVPGPITKAWASLDTLNLFPVYATREDYTERTGKVCPAWDPSKPEKHWEDPNADPAEMYIDYRQVVTTPAGPALKRLVVEADFAGRVNIPPNTANASNGRPPIPIPVRDLVAGVEELFIMSPFTGPVVKNVALFNAQQEAQQKQQGGFTASDREMLQRIAAKVGA